MFKNIFGKIALSASSLISSPAFAHTGIHNDVYHPLSGVDHFLVILIIGLLTGITLYYFYRK